MKKQIAFFMIIFVLTVSMSFGYSSKLEGALMSNQGLFGAAFLYQTYYAIGMASDAWTSNSYTPAQAKNITLHSINFLETTLKALGELIEFSITKEDRDVMLKMIDIANVLKNQATHMIQYIEKRQDEDLSKYDEYRKMAYEKLQKLINPE